MEKRAIPRSSRRVKRMELIVDVRTREEYVKNHIKGALNLPIYDLEFYSGFLKDKKSFSLLRQRKKIENRSG